MYTRPAGRPARRCACSTPTEDWQWWARVPGHHYRAAGIGPGDRVALAFSFGPHVQFWDARDGLERVGAMAITLGGMSSVQRLQTIAQIEATALVCTPSYALRLYEVAVEENLEGALASLAEGDLRGRARRVAAGRARADRGGPRRARVRPRRAQRDRPVRLPVRRGRRAARQRDEFVCEILDDDLRPAAPDARGELVLTPLGRRGWPVLRYRTGDVVVSPSEPARPATSIRGSPAASSAGPTTWS